VRWKEMAMENVYRLDNVMYPDDVEKIKDSNNDHGQKCMEHPNHTPNPNFLYGGVEIW